MNKNVIETIKKDIERCEQQTAKEGSYELYQTLTAKYNGLFQDFSDDIHVVGKAAAIGSEWDYRSELKAVKEKLELLLITEQEKDPLFQFKEMLSEDIESLADAIDDKINEQDKLQLYLSATAKYHPYVPQLGAGLFGFSKNRGLYTQVTGKSLDYNIQQIYNKLCAFRALNYPGLGNVAENTPNTFVSITNNNENHNTVSVTFESVRDAVGNMTSLPDEDIEEIKNKIDEIEAIVNSKESKSKKWSRAKEIVKWIADKGVDVGIALLPLILKIS